MDERLERNKQFVAEFYDVIINQKDFEKAKKYIGPRYKQHNPLVKDYPEGLCEFIEFLKRDQADLCRRGLCHPACAFAAPAEHARTRYY